MISVHKSVKWEQLSCGYFCTSLLDLAKHGECLHVNVALVCSAYQLYYWCSKDEKGQGWSLSFTFCFIQQIFTIFTLCLNLVYWFPTWSDGHYANIYTKLLFGMDITLAFTFLYCSLYENCCMTESLWWFCRTKLPWAWSNLWASTT